MAKKTRLSQLNKDLNKNTPAAVTSSKPQAKKKAVPTKKGIEANPARGQRGDFLKVTITLPHDIIAELKTVGLQRRFAGMKDTDISSLLREAAVDFLQKDVSP
jgi:hypothetical protein